MSRLKKVKINTLSNYGVYFLKTAISIITIPLLLEQYGDELYGIYLLSFGFVTTLSFLNFGAGKSILRYVGEYSSDNNVEKLNKNLSISIYLIVLGGVIVALLIFSISMLAPIIFQISQKNEILARHILMITAIYALVTFVQLITQNIIFGFQKIFKRNLFQSIVIVNQLMITIVVYENNLSLYIYVLLIFFNLLISVLFDASIIYRLTDLRKFRFMKMKTVEMRTSEAFYYAKNLFLISVVGTLSQNADKFILSLFLDIKYITVYAIISKPYAVVKSIYANIFSAIQPLIAQLKAGNEQKKIKTIIIDGTHYLLVIITPLISIILIFFNDLIYLWVGDGYSNFIVWGQILVVSLLFRTFFSLIFQALMFSGKIRFIRKVEYSTTFLNFAVSIFATYYLGVGGVVIGTFLQFFINVFLFSTVLKKEFNIDSKEFYDRTIIRYLILICLLTVADFIWVKDWFSHLKIDYFLMLAIHGLSVSIVLVTIMFYNLKRVNIKIL